MPKSIVPAEEINTSKKNESEKSYFDLYIGVFFDGTNNNKFQVMLGQAFRRQEILDKVRQRILKKREQDRSPKEKDILLNSFQKEDFFKHTKEFWEGILTKSESEQLFYGYDSREKYDTTIEEKSKKALLSRDNPSALSQTSMPDDKTEHETISKITASFAYNERIDTDKYASLKGGIGQETTYTNVAILESVYKNEEKEKEKYISIYIEGSGSDMQLEASTKTGYKSTIGLAGLGLGTGPTGVVAKIRKASMKIQQILDTYQYNNDVNGVNVHFDLFGFSRGATCARMMAYLINPDSDDPNNSYQIARIATKDNKKTDDLALLSAKSSEFLPVDGKTKTKEIRFMGLFDTVSSIGIIDQNIAFSALAILIDNTIKKEQAPNRIDIPVLWNAIKQKILPACEEVGKLIGDVANGSLGEILGAFVGRLVGNYVTRKAEEKVDPVIEEIKTYVQNSKYRDKGTADISTIPEGKSQYHKDNVKDYGLWATCLAKKVIHVCAIDEVRRNFALVDIQSSIDKNGTEVFIPGCHSDIGGGAAIGMEKEKIINKASDQLITSFYVHDKAMIENDKNLVFACPINPDSLKKIGWLNLDSKEISFSKKTISRRSKLEFDETHYCDNDHPANIIMYRHVTPGYSNVALNYIKEKAATDSFSKIPETYKVPVDLKDLYSKLLGISDKGRYFLYPHEYEQYTNLRRKYLHFSSNEQILAVADNVFVNGPEYANIDHDTLGKVKVTSRIIYPGLLEPDGETVAPMHMFDYEKGSPEQSDWPDSPLFQEEEVIDDRMLAFIPAY